MNSSAATAATGRTPAADWGWALGGALLWMLVLAGIPPTPFEGLDFSRICDPVLHLLRSSLLNGEMPWWDPYSSLGRPFAADMQTSTFYPTTYLSVLFGIRAGWMIATVAHGVLAIWGFTRFMHWLRVARPAAWGGAVIFLFSAPLLARMQAGQVEYVYPLCYLPLVMWLAARLATAPTLRLWAALALAWGLQLLCSHPQVSWLTALAAGAFVSGWLLQSPWDIALRAWFKAVIALATACACGLALLGFVVVPFLELAAQSNRALPSLAFSAMFAMTGDQWMSLLSPPSSVFAVNWEYSLHVGAVVLIGGLVAVTRWRDPVTRGLVLMIAVGLVIAVGQGTPLFAVLFKLLPGLSSFRVPARAGVVAMFGLLIGATVLAGTPSKGQRDRRVALLAGLLLAAVIIFYYLRRLPAGPASAQWLAGELAGVAAAIAAWWLWLGRTPGMAIGRHHLLLPGVVILEFWLAVTGLKRLPIFPVQFPVEAVVAAGARAHGLDRQIAPVRICVPPTLLRENSGMIFGYATLTGFESLSLSRVWNYLHRMAGVDPHHAYNTSPAGEVYDQAGRLGSVNLSVLLPPGSSVLEFNPAPDPRAYLATKITLVADAEAAVTRMIAGHPFHEDALVEPPAAGTIALGPPAGPGQAAITHFNLNSLEIEVNTPGAALLVVAEAWYPGWRATIAGHPAPCLPVNGWMRGVPVPAGHSTVQLTYHQNGLLPGCLISLLTALTLAWAARRRPGATT